MPEATKSANRVYRTPDGIIHADYAGDQTFASVSAVSATIQEMIQRVGGVTLIVMNGVGVTSQDSGARKAGLKAMNELHYSRLAIVSGPNRFVRHITNFVMQMSRKAEKIRSFETVEQAEAWLRAG